MATGTREDVVDLLLKQHEEIRALLDTVERSSGERRKQKFDELRQLLAVHETAEEEVVHPYARRKFGGDGAVDEFLDEERKGKEVLKRLEQVETGSSEFLPLFRELRASIEAHARHEEEAEFPQLRIKGSEDELSGMATLVKAAEAVAPTHPRPGVESQAKNLVLGPVAAVVDRAKDAIHKARS
ncbi:hemerythrin domain-containing protein [Actinocorallia populi]|uniref:hemerythrin domain-containing protein n=1 Tax=Actinocorallia populi TaxID=2079200 RepID=UPI000D08808C|nr:hemerythrin domain-containing protein [Actinocorallia populi]